MKALKRIVVWVLLVAAMLIAPRTFVSLPVEGRDALLEQYEGYVGVLRIWVCEGFEPGAGTLHSWLLGRIRQFEKRNPGVYVQISYVTREKLIKFASGKYNPPDMIMFAPGMLGSAEGLAELSGDYPLLGGLSHVGVYDGMTYALPVAMGGYALAVNDRLLPGGVPDSFEETTMSGVHLLSAPADSEYLSWSGALIALSMRAGEQISGEASPKVGDGIDLGLPGSEQAAATDEEDTSGDHIPLLCAGLPDKLPSDFRKQSSVYSAFTGSRAAMIPVTQREIRRLNTLGDSGRAPDWSLWTPPTTFTDQLALVSIVDWPREDIGDRQTLCKSFLDLLLSDDAQLALSGPGAFRVTRGEALYTADRAMAALEAALSGGGIIAPNAFGDSWRAPAASLADSIKAGDAAALDELKLLCGG